MNKYKKLFPIFKENPTLHYLDSAATALKPLAVLEKMTEYYTKYSANIHRGLYPISERATAEYEAVRGKAAKFIGAQSDQEIIFTSGTTDSINRIARGWGEKNLVDGDEVAVSEIEHHSNMVPWQELVRRKNLTINYFEIGSWEKVVTKKTKLLAITQVSNVLGIVNPIREIIRQARAISPDICVVVDGAQAVVHLPVDVRDLDCDFYAFSGHKLYGPTGVGVLYGKKSRLEQTLPVNFGGGMIKAVTMEGATFADGPEKYEAGTPPIAEVIGLGAAIETVTSIGFEEIQKIESELTEYLIKELNKLRWLTVLGEGEQRIGVVSFYIPEGGMGSSHDVADILAKKVNVCTRAGHHCAMPLHEKLGISTGTVRASVGIYNTKEDIDTLINGLEEVWTIFTGK